MSSSADYANVAGGSLKFKGGAGSKKKKKSKSSSVSKPKEEITGSGEGPSREGGSRRKTDAEKRFEEIQRERLSERIAKTASKTHKDRVHDLNAKLESLSEHHDIPRVGPG